MVGGSSGGVIVVAVVRLIPMAVARWPVSGGGDGGNGWCSSRCGNGGEGDGGGGEDMGGHSGSSCGCGGGNGYVDVAAVVVVVGVVAVESGSRGRFGGAAAITVIVEKVAARVAVVLTMAEAVEVVVKMAVAGGARWGMTEGSFGGDPP